MSGLAKLIKVCEKYRPHLIEAVNILLDGALFRDKPQHEDVLKSRFICGRATKVLGYFLSSEGYDVRKVTDNYFSQRYPSEDHTFLVVNTPDETIVDAAYYQFIDVFYLDREQMPSEDILVVPYSQLDKKVEEFVELRKLKFHSHSNPQILREHSFIFTIPDEELHHYFRRIWNFKQETYMTENANLLAQDIMEFDDFGISKISLDTASLINYLKKEKLLK